MRRSFFVLFIENYRPYQTTFQKTKIFGEVKEVLEGNSPLIGFSALATNLKVRFVPSVSLLSCWNHTNTDRSETHKLGHIALIRPPQKNDEFSTSKTFQGRWQLNKVLFTSPESQKVT